MEEFAKKLVELFTNIMLIENETVLSNLGTEYRYQDLETNPEYAKFDVEGLTEKFEELTKRKRSILDEIESLRIQAGEENQEALILEVSNIPGAQSERAKNYLRRVPFPKAEEAEVEITSKEKVVTPDLPIEQKKGFFGKLFSK
jgi:hypothetical protein